MRVPNFKSASIAKPKMPNLNKRRVSMVKNMLSSRTQPQIIPNSTGAGGTMSPLNPTGY